jgi:hypothetical protein
MYHENILPKLSWIIVLLILFTLLPACQSSQASSPTGTAATDSVPTTTSNTETTTPEETTLPFETTIPAITTDDGVFDKTDLLALLAEADAMLNEQNTFTLPLTTYINYAAGTVRSALEGYYSISEDRTTLTLQYNADAQPLREVFAYILFVDLLSTRYSDNICPYDYDYDPVTSNMPYFAVMFFHPGYQEAGYGTVLDCLKAIRSGDYKPAYDNFCAYIYLNGTGQIYAHSLSNLSDGIKIYDGDFEKLP